ncbi:MAG: LacI family DNA-binding transcriptional regulator [Gemmatimonadota bacterium]|nr:LacI family DNA-binding transcriptional regulator [Gemmatimonadota bacterium]MDE2954330.1 LacI family DNA-binding transcriptional regulator [Gemmatimonadota bacterium]
MKKNQATIKDIARQLGISYSTVSRALSPHASVLVKEKTRELVRQTAAEMDYSPNLMARGIVMGKTGTLGLLTYQVFQEASGYQTDQILRVADEHDYQIMMGVASNRILQSSRDDRTTQIKQLISWGVDGLLIHMQGDAGESERILDAVKGRVPVVTLHYPAENQSGVVLDYVANFYEATEHLIKLGHEQIGFIGEDQNEASPVSAKGKGYLLAMQKHDLTPKSIPVSSICIEAGYREGKELGGRFTALVCRDDYTAIGVCRGLRESGICVPEDVAVVGSGDIDVAAYMTPALTTLVTPYEAIAQAAMDLMLEQLEEQDEPRQVTLKSHLVVRESCGSNKSEK